MPHSGVVVLAFGAALALLVFLYHRNKFTSHILPLPPGPEPLPLLGNLFDLPLTREYETYTKWGKLYGDVVHVYALGKHIVVLNSVDAANELLDVRATIYSGRPVIPMLHDPKLYALSRLYYKH